MSIAKQKIKKENRICIVMYVICTQIYGLMNVFNKQANNHEYLDGLISPQNFCIQGA